MHNKITETEPLLKNRCINCEKGKMYIDTNSKSKQTVEIITNDFNYNFEFRFNCTNCIYVKKLGDTIHGIIIEVNKKNKDRESVLEWSTFK